MNIKFKGEVQVDIFEEKNNERVLVDSKVYYNTCTESLLTMWFTMTLYNLFDAEIALSTEKIKSGQKGFTYLKYVNEAVSGGSGVGANPAILSQLGIDNTGTQVSGFPVVVGDEYISFKTIFTAPTVQRTIQNILLINKNTFTDINGFKVYAYLDLITPCYQNPGQQVQVTYNIYFPTSIPAGNYNERLISTAIKNHTSNVYRKRKSGSQVYEIGHTLNMVSQFQKPFSERRLFSEQNTNCTQSPTGKYFPASYVDNNVTYVEPMETPISLTFNDQIGNFYRSAHIPAVTSYSNHIPMLQQLYYTSTDDAVKRVFPKTNASTLPFIDPESVLTTPTMTATSDNTFNAADPYSFPQIYKVEMYNDGYNFKQRKTTGLIENTYKERAIALNYPSAIMNASTPVPDPQQYMWYETNYLTDQSKQFVFDQNATKIYRLSDTKVLFLKSSEMMVYDVVEDDAIMINYYCSNVTGIGLTHEFRQATPIFESAASPQGTMTFLVADKSTTTGGLYVVDISDIEDITVTKITSVPELDNPIHGVYLRNDVVYVAYRTDTSANGGLIKSTSVGPLWDPNDSLSWDTSINLGGTNASIQGAITSWANVNTIKVSENEDFIAFRSSAHNNVYVYDISLATTTNKGALASGGAVNNTKYGVEHYYDVTDTYVYYITGSASGKADTLKRVELSGATAETVLLGTDVNTNILTTVKINSDYYVLSSYRTSYVEGTPPSQVTYYDNNIIAVNVNSGSPLTTDDIISVSTNSSVWYELKNRQDMFKHSTLNRFESNSLMSNFPVYLGNGLICSINHVYYGTLGSTINATTFVVSYLPSPSEDPMHGIFETEMWDEYGWNSGWVLDDPNHKTIHATSEELINGIYVSFPEDAGDYVPGVDGKYYLIYACDGIFKFNHHKVTIPPPRVMLSSENTYSTTTTIPSTNTFVVRDLEVGSIRTRPSAPNTTWYRDGKGTANPDTYICDIPFANYGAPTVTFDNSNSRLLCTGHQFEDRDIVRIVLGTGATIPTGLNTTTDYYIRVIDDNYITLTTSQGTLVTFTTNGSGTISLQPKYMTLTCKPYADVLSFSTPTYYGLSLSTLYCLITTDKNTDRWTTQIQVGGDPTIPAPVISSVQNLKDEGGNTLSLFKFKYNIFTSQLEIYIVNDSRVSEANQVEVLVRTISMLSSQYLKIENGGVYDMRLTIPHVSSHIIVPVGDSNLLTGFYNENFFKVTTWKYTDNYINIEQPSSPPEFYPSNFLSSTGPSTSVTSAYVAAGTGLIFFSLADAGKDVEINLNWVETF